MFPTIGERSFVERSSMRQRLFVLGQPGTGRNQQADRILHGIDVVDQSVRFDELQHLDKVIESGPGREADPGRTRRDSGVADNTPRGDDVLPRVLLVEDRQHLDR